MKLHFHLFRCQAQHPISISLLHVCINILHTTLLRLISYDCQYYHPPSHYLRVLQIFMNIYLIPMKYWYFIIYLLQGSPVPWSREMLWHVYPLILDAPFLGAFLFFLNLFTNRKPIDLYYTILFWPSACQALCAWRVVKVTAQNERSPAKRWVEAVWNLILHRKAYRSFVIDFSDIVCFSILCIWTTCLKSTPALPHWLTRFMSALSLLYFPTLLSYMSHICKTHVVTTISQRVPRSCRDFWQISMYFHHVDVW